MKTKKKKVNKAFEYRNNERHTWKPGHFFKLFQTNLSQILGRFRWCRRRKLMQPSGAASLPSLFSSLLLDISMGTLPQPLPTVSFGEHRPSVSGNVYNPRANGDKAIFDLFGPWGRCQPPMSISLLPIHFVISENEFAFPTNPISEYRSQLWLDSLFHHYRRIQLEICCLFVRRRW